MRGNASGPQGKAMEQVSMAESKSQVPLADRHGGKPRRDLLGEARRVVDLVLGGRGWLFAVLAVIGALLGLNQYEDRALENSQRIAHEEYAMVVSSLGSQSLVVRVGALGQLPALVRTFVPIKGAGHRPLEGLMYLLGYPEHVATYPYQDDLLRVIRALVVVPKDGSEGEKLEAEALLTMLCDLGPEGWFNARARRTPVRSEECLEWIWSDAPRRRKFDIPAYPLFEGASLRSASFGRKFLRRANFSYAKIEDSNFSDSVITNAHFANGDLRDVNFSNADLRYSDFSGAILAGVNFSGASLEYASFAGARLLGTPSAPVIFDQANVAGVDFRGADLAGASLGNAININLTQGHLQRGDEDDGEHKREE